MPSRGQALQEGGAFLDSTHMRRVLPLPWPCTAGLSALCADVSTATLQRRNDLHAWLRHPPSRLLCLSAVACFPSLNSKPCFPSLSAANYCDVLASRARDTGGLYAPPAAANKACSCCLSCLPTHPLLCWPHVHTLPVYTQRVCGHSCWTHSAADPLTPTLCCIRVSPAATGIPCCRERQCRRQRRLPPAVAACQTCCCCCRRTCLLLLCGYSPAPSCYHLLTPLMTHTAAPVCCCSCLLPSAAAAVCLLSAPVCCCGLSAHLSCEWVWCKSEADGLLKCDHELREAELIIIVIGVQAGPVGGEAAGQAAGHTHTQGQHTTTAAHNSSFIASAAASLARGCRPGFRSHTSALQATHAHCSSGLCCCCVVTVLVLWVTAESRPFLDCHCMHQQLQQKCMRVCMLLLCGGQRVNCSHRTSAMNGSSTCMHGWGLQVAVLRWISQPGPGLRGCLGPKRTHAQEHAVACSAKPTCMSDGCGLTLCTQDSASTPCQQGRCAMRADCCAC